MTTNPPTFILYPQGEHESMKTGVALALSLLLVPRFSDADRLLAASELAAVVNRMQGAR